MKIKLETCDKCQGNGDAVWYCEKHREEYGCMNSKGEKTITANLQAGFGSTGGPGGRGGYSDFFVCAKCYKPLPNNTHLIHECGKPDIDKIDRLIEQVQKIESRLSGYRFADGGSPDYSSYSGTASIAIDDKIKSLKTLRDEVINNICIISDHGNLRKSGAFIFDMAIDLVWDRIVEALKSEECNKQYRAWESDTVRFGNSIAGPKAYARWITENKPRILGGVE